MLGSAFLIRHSSDAPALHSPEPRPERLATYLQAEAERERIWEAGAGAGKYFNKLATLDLIDFHFESQIFQRAEKF